MGFEDLVIIKILKNLFGGIDEFLDNSPILKGFAFLAAFALILYLVGYVLIYGAILGNVKGLLITLGIILLMELANLIGGGHH